MRIQVDPQKCTVKPAKIIRNMTMPKAIPRRDSEYVSKAFHTEGTKGARASQPSLCRLDHSAAAELQSMGYPVLGDPGHSKHRGEKSRWLGSSSWRQLYAQRENPWLRIQPPKTRPSNQRATSSGPASPPLIVHRP